MKDDKPKRKSQKDQSGQEPADSQLPSFQKDAEDVDFEILDALEQIEHPGKENGAGLLDEESEFELSLDEEELSFDEEEPEAEGAFQLDESLTAGLEEELTGKAEEFSLAASLGEERGEDVQAGIEDREREGEFSFDEEMDLELQEETGESAFDLGELEGTDFTSETEVEEEAEIEDTSSEMFDLGEDVSSLLSSEKYAFDAEAGSSPESADLGLEDTDETFGEMDLGEMAAMNGDLDFETDLGDDSALGMEFSETDFEDEADEFSGKAVLSVAGDQVVDLGNETEFDQEEELGSTASAYADEAEETDESFDLSEEEGDEELAELEKGVHQRIGERIVSGLPAEQEHGEEEPDEEFMSALGDIDIDLEEETTKVLETLKGADEFSGFAEDVPGSFDADSFDVTPDAEQASEVATVAAGPGAQTFPETGAEASDLESDLVSIELEEPAEVTPSEVDEREELGLTPRLIDSEIHKFESMVNEAKTLQKYVAELAEHKTEVKEKIYQKLLQEYTSRKTEIFRESEFISIRIDVEQDLQDMLARRTEFVATIDRLNDELEEVQVRHLVGEYTDTMLSDREAAQKAARAQWHDKTEKIEKFITRYQELLDIERELNPLEKEPRPEQEQVSPAEEIAPEEEMPFAEEIAEKRLPEEAPEEETVIPAEGAAEDLELDALVETFAEDFGLGELSGMDEGIDAEPLAVGDEIEKDETTPEDMINCKKCARLTPTSEKFCVNCGAKAR